MRLMLGFAAALAVAACATNPITGGPRPPQGPGPGGTQFGFWDRDAEGAVDADFRSYVTRAYNVGEETKARTTLETDGFKCMDGNRPDGRPVPELECERIYSVNDDVHAWTVEFWPKEREPRAHYSRTHIRDTTKYYKEKRG
ncbi:MAG: hypothetical protein Q8R82_09250 [Hyphomonadaceae bacterium]|nr:hypothetical protein [Hyphomonadaceae bacterium]